MYKLVIEYADPSITDSQRSQQTFEFSTQLTDYEAYGCCLDSSTILFDCDLQRTIAVLVIGDDPRIKRLRLG